MTNFADDNFIIRWSNSLEELIDNMRKDHEKITKWLRDSGLVLNEAKTDLCLFNRSYLRQIQLDFNGSVIKSLPQINML